jgi:hypothetical protein
MHLVKYIIIYFIIYFDNLIANQNDFNPYETLSLSRTASDKEIRQAYKKLAKYWHPDKNSEPNAHDQFTKINAAYEVKAEEKKKGLFNSYKFIIFRFFPIQRNDKIMMNMVQHHKIIIMVLIPIIFEIHLICFEHIFFKKHHPVQRKLLIHSKFPSVCFINLIYLLHFFFASEFLNNILPNSDKKPYLIFGSTNFCFHCRQPLTIFRSMENQLNDVGM